MSAETVFSGRMITVVVDGKLEIVHHPDVVAIVAVESEYVTLVRQPRPATGHKLLELPAGKLEDGEEPLASARRELLEETGLRGGEWTELGSFYMSPGFCDERVTVFAAHGVEQGDAAPDDDEDIELVRVPLAEIPALLGELEDAKTLAGLMLYLRSDPGIVPPP